VPVLGAGLVFPIDRGSGDRELSYVHGLNIKALKSRQDPRFIPKPLRNRGTANPLFETKSSWPSTRTRLRILGKFFSADRDIIWPQRLYSPQSKWMFSTIGGNIKAQVRVLPWQIYQIWYQKHLMVSQFSTSCQNHHTFFTWPQSFK